MPDVAWPAFATVLDADDVDDDDDEDGDGADDDADALEETTTCGRCPALR